MSLSVTNFVLMCPTCDRTPDITQRPKERLLCPIKYFVRSPDRAPSCFAPAMTFVVECVLGDPQRMLAALITCCFLVHSPRGA